MANKRDTFVDIMELVIEDVAKWAHTSIKSVLDSLAPDGRAFEERKLSQEEQIELWLRLRGSPEKWGEWVTQRVQILMDTMASSGVSEEAILAAHPHDLAWRMALNYDAQMRALYARRVKRQTPADKAIATSVAPTLELLPPPSVAS